MEDRIRGAFAGIYADDALIADTLAYLREETEKRQRKTEGFTLPMRLRAVAAMALLVAAVFSYSLYFTAAAHVSIDVNPSVELTLNRFDRVIGTYAFNEDGANILSGSDLRGKAYGVAAELLLSAIEADGYITKGALVSVTVQAASSEKEQTICEALLQSISKKILPVQTSAEIEIFPVSAEVWGNAHGCNISPARFLAIQELIEVDESATMEDYADTSIRQIRRRTQECLNRHNTQSNGNDSVSGQQNGHEQSSGHMHGYMGGHSGLIA